LKNVPEGGTCFEPEPHTTETCAEGLFCQREAVPFGPSGALPPTRQGQIEGTCVRTLIDGSQCHSGQVGACQSGTCIGYQCVCLGGTSPCGLENSLPDGAICRHDGWCANDCVFPYNHRPRYTNAPGTGDGVCGRAPYPDGSYCPGGDSQCASGICYQQQCLAGNILVGACFRDDQCVPPRTCEVPIGGSLPGQCLDLLPGGYACTSGSHCVTGVCNGGACTTNVVSGACGPTDTCTFGPCWSDGFCGKPRNEPCQIGVECRSHVCESWGRCR
jgi:hypothetical protein